MNQFGMNMMNNINNLNLNNNMNQIQNQINSSMNMYNPFYNQINYMPFNQMGINNNFTNPYQRIIELENIIKEKDLEIENLKKKLRNFFDLENIPCFNETDFTQLNFTFIPSENPQNVIEFQKFFNKKKKFIKAKRWVAKKLNKNLNDLYFECNNWDSYLIDDNAIIHNYSNSNILIKEVINEEDYNMYTGGQGEILEIKFIFIPLDNPKNIIEFKEKCNSGEICIKIKIRLAKKLQKKLNNLSFKFNGFPFMMLYLLFILVLQMEV